MKKSHIKFKARRSPLACGALAFAMLSSCTAPSVNHAQVPRDELMPESLSDPIEPFNRGVWEFNRGLMHGFLHPLSAGYRGLVPAPARASVRNFSRNITYPGRLLNHALQGRWSGAGDESLRFLCNTTAGVGGLFDVASRWKVGRSDADFAQTFSQWGWKPQNFVVLPFLGPSSDAETAGLIADKAAEPTTYITAVRGVSGFCTFNRLSESADDAARLLSAEADSYVLAKATISGIANANFTNHRHYEAADQATLETLGVAAIRCESSSFPFEGRTMSVRIDPTGKSLKYNCWLQRDAAPLVFVMPGLGSHRLSLTALAVAEHLYANGFSVVTISSVFHPEFMSNASTAALPAYAPVDSNDLLIALSAINNDLEKRHPGRFGKRAIIGLSMGGFQTLQIAAREKSQSRDLLVADRYVAINSPVNLRTGAGFLDAFYKAPLQWPQEERDDRINQTATKALMMLAPGQRAKTPPVTFGGNESKYLIGLNFRFILRDAIFNSQSRHNLGKIQAPLSSWSRNSAYDEISRWSYSDYFHKLVVPYYATRGITASQIIYEADLRNKSSQLRSNSKIRVVSNHNDFLLGPSDAAWLKSTFPGKKLTMFPNGGHLGNLSSPPMRAAILEALKGLR
ncbi:MAG: alpha/beta fold hydrolase [Verrucomicrobia bacterium]|nr:alpha/beta fold hydrolase [Verrucomicrobiota bacterium]